MRVGSRLAASKPIITLRRGLQLATRPRCRPQLSTAYASRRYDTFGVRTTGFPDNPCRGGCGADEIKLISVTIIFDFLLAWCAPAAMASKSKKAKVAEIEATQGFADTQAFAAAAVGRGALDSDDDADNRKRAREDDEDDYEAGAGAGAGAKPSAKSSRAEQSASADADGADTDEEGPSTPVKASTAASVKTRHALPVPANARVSHCRTALTKP